MSMQGFCPDGEEKGAEGNNGQGKCYGYLDIETTGCSRYADLTVVGVGLVQGAQQRFGQLFGDRISEEAVLGLLDGVDEV